MNDNHKSIIINRKSAVNLKSKIEDNNECCTNQKQNQIFGQISTYDLLNTDKSCCASDLNMNSIEVNWRNYIDECNEVFNSKGKSDDNFINDELNYIEPVKLKIKPNEKFNFKFKRKSEKVNLKMVIYQQIQYLHQIQFTINCSLLMK